MICGVAAIALKAFRNRGVVTLSNETPRWTVTPWRSLLIRLARDGVIDCLSGVKQRKGK
jgi:hypothetical protein